MDRGRTFAGALACLLLTAGCLGAADPGCTGESTLEVRGGEPTLAPGNFTTITVAVANATGVRMGVPTPPGDADVDVRAGDASLSPSPDRTGDAYPPVWTWNDCADVEIVVPVYVADDADPGEYSYTVSASLSLDGTDRSVERTFTVTVDDAGS